MKLAVPRKWSHITFDKYIKILEVIKKEISPLEKSIEQLSILTEVSPEEIESLPTILFSEYLQLIQFLAEAPTETDFRFKIEGIEYNLPINFNTLAIGKWSMCDQYLKHYEGFEAVPYMISVLVQKEKYTEKDIDNMAAKIKQLDMETLWKLNNFFLPKEKSQQTYFLQSSISQIKEEIQKHLVQIQEKDFITSTDGMKPFLKRFVIKMYSKLIKRILWNVQQSSTTSPIYRTNNRLDYMKKRIKMLFIKDKQN